MGSINEENQRVKISRYCPFKRDRVTRITDMLDSYLQYRVQQVKYVYIHRWLQCTAVITGH